MYRKVHNTMLAFSTTGVLLLVGLMLGAPTLQSPQQKPLLVRTVAVGPLLVKLESPAGRSAEVRAAAIEARAEALAAQIGAGTSSAEAVAQAATFAAGIATDAVFLAALAEDDSSATVVKEDEATTRHRRQVRRAREALALPYFSFAQGLRRNRS